MQVPLVEDEKQQPPVEPTEDVTTWVFEAGTFVPAAKIKGDKRYSIVTDYLGTPIQMYDEQGEKTWDCTLDVYGKVANFEGSSLKDVPLRYQGQYEDQETGLYYNRFRYYEPGIGSYLSQDPIRLAGNNPTLYAYVPNPNTWLDPLGLECLKPERGYLRGKKHGILQQDADAIKMAKESNNPVGRWGNKTDLEYAGNKAETLAPGEMGDFPINPGSKSTVFNPDGSQSIPDMIRVRNNGDGTFHGFPMDSSTAGPIFNNTK